MSSIPQDPQGLANVRDPERRSTNLPGSGSLTLISREGEVIISAPQTEDILFGFDSRLTKNTATTLTENQIDALKCDPTISLVRELVISPAVSTPWTIKEKENTPEGARDLIERVFLKHRIDLIQDSFFGCIDHGWAPFEVVWGLDKEQNQIPIWFKKLLHEWTWILVYLDGGQFAGFINEPLNTGHSSIILESKTLNVNFEVEGTNWYGVSSLRKAKKIQVNWNDVNSAANGFDKRVSGAHWVIYYPVGTTKVDGVSKDNGTIAKNILENLKANGSTAVPDEVQEWMDDTLDKEMKGKWRIELLSASGNLNAQYTDRLKYLDNLKARALGLPERAVLEGKFGTKAEADTHAEAGIANIDRKHRLIVKQLNEGPVNNILRVNYGEDAVNSVCIEVAPLVDARFSLLRESFSRMLQDGGALETLFNDVIDIRSMVEELDVPIIDGGEQPKIERPEFDQNQNQNLFSGENSNG